MWDSIWPYLAAILPTIFVAIIFYFIMRHILEADRRERVAQSAWEREQDERAAREGKPAKDIRRTEPGDPEAPGRQHS